MEADAESGHLRLLVPMEPDRKPSNGVYSRDGQSLFYVLTSKHVYGQSTNETFRAVRIGFSIAA